MAEDGDPPGVYTLVCADGSSVSKSRGYSGKGKATYENGDVYEGEFVDGIKQGKGVYTYKNGDKFTGTYHANKRTGLGRIDFNKGGAYYHGYFQDGKRHGEGTEKYVNGDVYSGQWREGKKHGRGTYSYATTRFKFVGDWEGGQMTKGRWVWKNGCQYVGTFENNKPSGKGLWLFPNGTQMEGTYAQKVLPVDQPRLKPVKKPADGESKPAAPAPTGPLQRYDLKWKTEGLSVLDSGPTGK
eukprot:GDKI01011399.1.p1 GENE.GDKI01011399.1~~GDKI01011399.1.p1  ORF type:complete len:258 (+),score=61.40 GDKI01011399.1:52-774(+)